MASVWVIEKTLVDRNEWNQVVAIYEDEVIAHKRADVLMHSNLLRGYQYRVREYVAKEGE